MSDFEEQIANSLVQLGETANRLVDATTQTGPFPSYVISFATIAIAITAAFLAFRQLTMLRRQIEYESRRSMKASALMALHEFNKGLRPEYEDLGSLLDAIGSGDLEKLKTTQAFCIAEAYKNQLQHTLNTASPNEEFMFADEKIGLLSHKQVHSLRSIVVDFVNHLENALAPAFADVADKELVKSQLRPYFVEPVVTSFRPIWNTFGSDLLPCTHKMLREIDEENRLLANR